MEELARIIGLQWDGDAGSEARELAPGGLWFQEAPETVLTARGTPYVVFYFMPGAVDDTNTSKIEVFVVQFSAFVTEDISIRRVVRLTVSPSFIACLRSPDILGLRSAICSMKFSL